MDIPEITLDEFLEFFEVIEEYFGNDELVFFDGRCTGSDVDNYEDWVFTLVNSNRNCHIFVPTKIAFYYINLALSNVSLLPNSFGTEYITCARMRSLISRYKLQHLTALYPYTAGQYYTDTMG